MSNSETGAGEISMTDAMSQAAGIGSEHGKAAASWCFDGNTDQETYRTVLAGIDDGDPAVLDMFREPSFSGEYGCDYSERDLCADLDIDYDASETGEIDEIADAYLEAARGEFWAEIERMARRQLS